MAGKNTAVFGIYQDRVAVEHALDMLRQAGYRNTSQSSFHTTKAPRILPLRRAPKRPRGQMRQPVPAWWWVGPLGWRASEH
jgi:hypothetical protein